MNLKKLNPWNWFKHEDAEASQGAHIPVLREEASRASPSLGQQGPWQQGQHPVRQLHQEIDRLFDDVFGAFGRSAPGASASSQLSSDAGMSRSYHPQIDVAGDEKQYEIKLDVPGLSDEDLSIEVRGDVLLIKGQKEEKNEQRDKQFYRVERSFGAFQRTLALPADANADAIEARLKDGVLVLAIPRLESEPGDVKRISISSE